MKKENTPHQDQLKKTVEAFWESFPPFWHRIRAHIREVTASQFDITVEQFHILRHIKWGEGSVSGLAEAKSISRPAISRAVEILVGKGFIARETSSEDRRRIKLVLTGSGRDLLQAIFDNTRKWMMELMRELSAPELESLEKSMNLLRKFSCHGKCH
jgi:DNA-binding MarR family transcriptional regulator